MQRGCLQQSSHDSLQNRPFTVLHPKQTLCLVHQTEMGQGRFLVCRMPGATHCWCFASWLVGLIIVLTLFPNEHAEVTFGVQMKMPVFHIKSGFGFFLPIQTLSNLKVMVQGLGSYHPCRRLGAQSPIQPLGVNQQMEGLCVYVSLLLIQK